MSRPDSLTETPTDTLRELPAIEWTARARLDRVTFALFELDHLHRAAWVVKVYPREADNSGTNMGLYAEIQPFAEIHHADDLAGCTLRLMSHPFNGETVYRITQGAR